MNLTFGEAPAFGGSQALKAFGTVGELATVRSHLDVEAMPYDGVTSCYRVLNG